jgi:hypothetical protein
VVKLLI